MVKIIASDTTGQGPAGSSLVIVSVTNPASTSAAEAVYAAPTMEASSKVPVPEVVHCEDSVEPPIVPDRI